MIIKRRSKLFSDYQLSQGNPARDLQDFGKFIKKTSKKVTRKIKEGQEKRRVPRGGYGIDPVDGFHIHQQHMMDHSIAHSIGTGLM